MKLRKYQEDAVARIRWALSVGGNSVVVLPTGAGKSLVIAYVARCVQKNILILQPSLEILKQNKEKLLHYVDKNEVGVFSASAGEKTINKYTFATIGSVYKKPELFKDFGLVLIDECFPAGTNVSGRDIEDIKVGDYVHSYNHNSQKIEIKKVVAVSKKWYVGDFTCLNDGLIISTSNHPIYTYESGYKKAEEVKRFETIAFFGDALQSVWKRYDENNDRHDRTFLRKSTPLSVENKKTWICLLLKKMWNEFPLTRKFGKDENEKSNVIEDKQREDVRYIEKDWTQTKNSRREWQRYDHPSKNVIRRTWRKLVSRAYCYHREWLCTTPLQNRLGQPCKKNCCRSGWWSSLFKNSSEKRQEKGNVFNLKGLEGVQIQKSRSIVQSKKGCWVYNLEVEENHNYFANGVLVHNCHLLNNKKDNSMYNSFLKDIGMPKSIGFTATPYRVYPTYFYNEVGQLYQTNSVKIITRTRPQFFDKIVYNINYADLVEQGYLSPIRYVDRSLVNQKELKVNKSGTDFDLPSFDLRVDAVESEVIETLTDAQTKFKHILVFCSSVNQAKRLSERFKCSDWVSGETDKKTREKLICDFKEGVTQMVFNVGVLTTGFDFPALDCIALLRPTRSPALYYQMLGRGVRKAEGKEYCTVIDFTNTVEQIGRLESLHLGKVDGMWNLISETVPSGWNGVELYRFAIDG